MPTAAVGGSVVGIRLSRLQRRDQQGHGEPVVVLSVREDGQKVLLGAKNMGGEPSEAWRAVLDGFVSRGLPGCRSANGRAHARPMQSNGSTGTQAPN